MKIVDTPPRLHVCVWGTVEYKLNYNHNLEDKIGTNMA